MKLDELKALDAAATPGPWHSASWGVGDGGVDVVFYPDIDSADAALIAAARNALPKLLAVAEAAKRVCARMRDGEPGITDYDDAVDDLERSLDALEAQP